MLFFCRCFCFSNNRQANSFHPNRSRPSTNRPHTHPLARTGFSPTPPTSARHSLTSSPSSSTSSQAKPNEIDRELIQNIATLQSLFPTEQKSQLVAVLATCDNDIDRATDRMIEKGRGDGTFYIFIELKHHSRELIYDVHVESYILELQLTRKRKVFNRILSDSSNEDDSIVTQPIQKKARPLQYDDSQDSQETIPSGSQSTQEIDPVTALQQDFPQFSLEVCVQPIQLQAIAPLLLEAYLYDCALFRFSE